jgi:MFS family permease
VTSTTWVLAVTLAIQAMVSMALLTLPVMAPVVAQDLQVSPAYVGLYVAMAYVGAIMASLASGTAIVRWGAIRVSQIGLVVCAAGLGLCAIPSLPLVALGAWMIGVGYGPITPASSHLLARTTPAHRLSLVFSVKQTGVPLGGVLAGLIVPSLMLAAGWQAVLLVVALVSLVCAGLAQPMRAELDADRDPQAPLALGHLLQPLQLVFSHRVLSMLAICSFVFSSVQLSLVTYLVTYLHDALAMGLVAAGVALSVSQMAGVGGRVFWGFVADRYTGARLMLASLAVLMAVSSVGTALLGPTVPTWVLWLVLALFGASAIGWNGVYLAEVARQAPPGKASMATGGTLSMTFSGVVLGPPLFGALSGSFGSYRAGYLALALPVLLCAVWLLKTRPTAP